MKIAEVTPYYHPHIGGVESYVHELSKHLMRLDHEVTIITARYDKTLPEEDEHDGIRILRTDQLMNIFTTPVTPKLKTHILAERWDIVHTHAPPPLSSYYIAKAKKNGRFPVVLTYHCDLEIPLKIGGILTELYRFTFGSYTMKRMDQVLVTTETYAATSKAIWNTHAKVIPLGIDIDRFNPRVKGDAVRKRHDLGDSKVVMFVGRLAYHKGVKHFIEAAERYPKAKYLIVGTGPKESALRKQAAAMKNAKNIIFAGKVDGNDLPQYYAACDVLVLPSVSRLEAFGMVTLEALSSGTPVVVSDMPGMREVVVDGIDGFLAEPLNPQDIANKVRRLLENDELRRQFGANGRLKIEEMFTWPMITERIVKAFERTIEKHDRSSSSKGT